MRQKLKQALLFLIMMIIAFLLYLYYVDTLTMAEKYTHSKFY